MGIYIKKLTSLSPLTIVVRFSTKTVEIESSNDPMSSVTAVMLSKPVKTSLASLS